jgi:radical SAM protein with 4Fe4S-binding SPASM domain
MLASILSCGYDLTADDARRMSENGVATVSVSVDGLEDAHRALRGKPDSWRRCFEAFAHFREAGLPFACNTQLNRLTAPDLPRLYERLLDAGVGAWQLQTTTPMGNAADCAEILLQPPEMGELYPVLARLVARGRRDGVRVVPADCVGYFGPDETFFRDGATWQGCQAGLCALGIEADGAIKGCLSLPTEEYIGGNVRERPLREIVQTDAIRLNVGGGTPEGTRHLHGFCATCEHAALCRGGCSNTAHVLFGRRGDNPFCQHRILTLARRGLRERVVLAERADDGPFSIGRFDLVAEPRDVPWPADDPLRFGAEDVTWPEGFGNVRRLVRFRGGPGKEEGRWKSIS